MNFPRARWMAALGTTALVSLATFMPAAAQNADPIGTFENPGVQTRLIARTWFPDAGAGGSAEGLALVAQHIQSFAQAGFGGSEVAFLSDNTKYNNDDARTIGFGSPNWRNIAKQILRTANAVPGEGFGVDFTITTHWPITVNNIDPNDDAQQHQITHAITKLTAEDLSKGTIDLPLPPLRLRDALSQVGHQADFVFAEKFVGATLAKVVGFNGNQPIYQLASLTDVTSATRKKIFGADDAAAGRSYLEVGGVKYSGTPAGIPDQATAQKLGIDYSKVLSQWGPEPSGPLTGSFTGKIDANGNRKRMADWQYLYQINLGNVPALRNYQPSTGANLAVGDYVLFASYSEGTGQIMSGGASVTEYNRPYVSDIYSAAGTEAITDFWGRNLLDPEMLAMMKANAAKHPFDAMFEDSYEINHTTPFWTVGMTRAISQTGGYDAARYLPLYALGTAADFDDPTQATRLLEDYTITLGKVYRVNHVQGIEKWAAGFGYKYRAQAEGGMPGIAGAETDLGIIEIDGNENFDQARNAAGGTNLAGTTLTSDESMTFEANDYVTTWNTDIATLNGHMSAGINRFIVHGSPFARTFNNYNDAWPGWDFILGRIGFGAFTYRQVYWQDMPQFSDYIARTLAVLQGGLPRVDVAVLDDEPEHYRSVSGVWFRRLLDAGYSYNIIDESMFDLPRAKFAGGVLGVNGPAYRAIVVHRAQEMTPAGLRRLIAYAEGGLPVILFDSNVTRVYGTSGANDADRQVTALFRQLESTKNVTIAQTKEQVTAQLAAANILPAASYEVSLLQASHRVNGPDEFYYLYGLGTSLAAPAKAGATSIAVQDTSDLKPGDKLFLGNGAASETVTIASVTPTGSIDAESQGFGGGAPGGAAPGGPTPGGAGPGGGAPGGAPGGGGPGTPPAGAVPGGVNTGAFLAPSAPVAARPNVTLTAPLKLDHAGPGAAPGGPSAAPAGDGISTVVDKTITLTGNGVPYRLDAWTGKATPLGLYTSSGGKVSFTLDLMPNDATIIALRGGEQAMLHATATSGGSGGEVLYTDAGLVHRASAPGTYSVTLSSGANRTVTVAAVPTAVSLGSGWQLDLNSWGPDPEANKTDPSVSKITPIRFDNIPLGLWSTLPATSAQLQTLGVPSMRNVIGMGTYTQQFTLPADWNGQTGAYLLLGHNKDVIAEVTVNGQKLAVNDIFTDRLDVGHLLHAGSNTISVRIDTLMANRVPNRTIFPFGLTEIRLIPYVETPLAGNPS